MTRLALSIAAVCAVLSVRGGDCAGLSSPSGRLAFSVGTRDGSFAVCDTLSGRTYCTTSLPTRVRAKSVRCEGGAVVAELEGPKKGFAFRAEWRFDGDELLVSVDGGDAPFEGFLWYPAPMATEKGDRLVVPLNEGMWYPADEKPEGLGRKAAYSGHGLSMSFFGVCREGDGSGWMAIIETPDDGEMQSGQGRNGFWSLGPCWVPQNGKFGYARRLRYVFFEKGGYVAMAKRYREYAKKNGLWKPLAEKAKRRPQLKDLAGAANVWCWDSRPSEIAAELQTAGVERILWSVKTSPREIKKLLAMPHVLSGRYDIYQDVNHPEQIARLEMKNPINTEAWPDKIAWDGPSSNDWRRAWGIKDKNGEWTYCATMCDLFAPDFLRRNLAAELPESQYNARFIDTTFASPFNECRCPAHPMTRTVSKKMRAELMRVVGEEYGLVAGTENGHEASVPVCDYYEGMMSVGPYRVRDSGRNMSETVDPAPPQVAKYQVGERYRIPLWELVFHDCAVSYWYWGDYQNKVPSVWRKRDLFNALYGNPPMYMFSRKTLPGMKVRVAESYAIAAPTAKATFGSEMTDHRALSPDMKLQRSRFADGTTVTVNFGEESRKTPEGEEIAPLSAVWKKE